MTELTPEKIRRIFDYEPETGLLFWKVKPSPKARVNIGDATGSKHGGGYLKSVFCGKDYQTHRLIFAWFHGHWPKDQVDHINGVRTDNRIVNLRGATPSENQKNAKLSKRNKSGCTGVVWNKACNKWRAQIQVDYKAIHLGFFTCLPDAIKVRQDANVKYGFHKNHGGKYDSNA